MPRTDVAGILPSREAIVRLGGAVLAGQNGEWAEARRYLGLEILAVFKKAENNAESSETGVTMDAIDA